MDIIEEVNEELCRLSKIRHQQMGDIDSGMYNYYIRRTAENAIVDECDRYLIKYVKENTSLSSRICELASGLGQISMVLNKMGYKDVTAYEHDKRRYKYAVEMNAVMGLDVKYICDAFQKLVPTKFDVIIANNIINTSNNFKNEIEIIKNWISNNVKFIFKHDLYDHTINALTILNENNIKYKQLNYGFITI